MAANAETTHIESRLQSASTLSSIVDLVRRITHADVTSIVSFSLAEKTMTWRAASGFQKHVIDNDHMLVRPISNRIFARALSATEVLVVNRIGKDPEFPAENFPVHVTEGVHDLAVAVLRARGTMLGALIAGYRSPHEFSDDERQLLQGLADLAAVTLDNTRLFEGAKRSESRMAGMITSAMDAVISVDAEQRIVLFNPAAEKMFGCSASEAMGNSLDLFIPERFRHTHASHIKEFGGVGVTARRMGALGDLMALRANGEEFPIEASISQSEIDHQKLFTVILRDITKRKEAEGALRESEERARQAQQIWEQTFAAIGEGILAYDEDQRIIRCNPKAAEMMETDPSAVIGVTFGKAFAKMFGKRAADYYLTDNYDAPTMVEVETDDGRRYLVSIFPVHKPDGTWFTVVTWNDVTRLSEMQNQLGRSRRLASVGQLAAGVAHEVNNPLAAITTCAEAIMRDLHQQPADALPPAAQWNYYLEEIVRQSLRCKEMTRGLLDLTRQRQAKRVLADINAIAKECSKVAVQRAKSSAHVEMKLDDAIPQVATDVEMVRQILDNFLTNAIDALSDEGGMVTVSTKRLGDRVAIEVADTGSGIPSELLAQIFDPFFSTKGPGKGYGLGLAISLTLAETLGGGISVESKVGKGSRFRLWLPRRAPE